jgi:hypothetical protein
MSSQSVEGSVTSIEATLNAILHRFNAVEIKM